MASKSDFRFELRPVLAVSITAATREEAERRLRALCGRFETRELGVDLANVVTDAEEPGLDPWLYIEAKHARNPQLTDETESEAPMTTTSGKKVYTADHEAYELARQHGLGEPSARIPGANDEDLTLAHAITAALDRHYPGWSNVDHREAGTLHAYNVFADDDQIQGDPISRAACNAHYCAESIHGQRAHLARTKQEGE